MRPFLDKRCQAQSTKVQWAALTLIALIYVSGCGNGEEVMLLDEPDMAAHLIQPSQPVPPLPVCKGYRPDFGEVP